MLAESIGDLGARTWYLSARATSAGLEGRFADAQGAADELIELLKHAAVSVNAWPDLIVDGAHMLRCNVLWQRGLAGDLTGATVARLEER